MELVKVDPEEFNAGVELPWAVYNSGGRLLLPKGYVIYEEQLYSVQARELYRISHTALGVDAAKVKPSSAPFDVFYSLVTRLNLLFADAVQGKEGIPARLAALVDDIHLLCLGAPDATLGMVHLCHDVRYTLCHPLQVAILCDHASKWLGQDDERRKAVMTAAVAANIAIIELQEKLYAMPSPLDPAQKEVVAAHPAEAARILGELGFKDERVLKLVEQHHERSDGTGYPKGLKGDAIEMDAMALGLADSYAAMVSARAYRHSFAARDALRDFFVLRGTQFAEELSIIFIKMLGVYPSGSFVRLENGETAVVIKQSEEADVLHPLVSSYSSASGNLFTMPKPRETAREGFKIVESLLPDYRVQTMLNRLWGYD